MEASMNIAVTFPNRTLRLHSQIMWDGDLFDLSSSHKKHRMKVNDLFIYNHVATTSSYNKSKKQSV